MARATHHRAGRDLTDRQQGDPGGAGGTRRKTDRRHPSGAAVTDDVFQETAAQPRTRSVPLAHLSLELGHLYMEDFEGGPERLREHFRRIRPWVDAIHAETSLWAGPRRPRISTCFLIDDYFTRF